jgi:hypothetical protein
MEVLRVNIDVVDAYLKELDLIRRTHVRPRSHENRDVRDHYIIHWLLTRLEKTEIEAARWFEVADLHHLEAPDITHPRAIFAIRSNVAAALNGMVPPERRDFYRP